MKDARETDTDGVKKPGGSEDTVSMPFADASADGNEKRLIKQYPRQ